jgi:hypothetical protein
MFIAALATMTGARCSPERAEAKPVLRDPRLALEAVGDTLRTTVYYRATGADSVRWAFAVVGRASATLTRPGTATSAGPVSLVPNPPIADGDSAEVTATWTAYRAGQSFPGGTVRRWYRRPVTPPSVIVDSLQVIGLIAVPESGWVRPAATLIRNTWDAQCAGVTSTTACMADVEFTRCQRYMNGAQVGGLGSPMDQAVGVTRLARPVFWNDQFGRQYQMGGVVYNPDGTPHPECVGYLNPVCIVADLVDGSRVLTVESWQRPGCRRQLYRSMDGGSQNRWTFANPDTTRMAEYPRRMWETATAHRANYMHEPLGIGRPGVPGYAALRPGPAYPIGLCGCHDTVRAAVGQGVELAVRVRMSDGTIQKLTDSSHVFIPNQVGVTGYTGRTPWGEYRVVVIASGRGPQRPRQT